MIKIIAIGVWVCVVSLGSSYGMALFASKSAPTEKQEPSYFEGLDYRKTDPITVPVIYEDKIRGYILARFVYTIDGKTVAGLAVPPDPFMLDEAYRVIYSAKGFDFDRPERYDVAKLTEDIKKAVNARYKKDIVEDVLIEQFDYIEKDKVQHG
ncbi:hypothetical protein NPA31_001955 [Aurantimonas sp. MSK8Z-1]|uniref:hypothetical protein n=1 Tax=Mangrovibrevibacter kandeliae TaxID=2968473 RepID=UPI002118A68B|nr:hypothetical protein [Aurantimonas sp. MSK8Z-1]MCW4113725.1 hypothetical protein [Aurantimonas sp. MSK8Z-1]